MSSNIVPVRPVSASPSVGATAVLVTKPQGNPVLVANSTYYQGNTPDSPQSAGSGGAQKTSCCPCCFKTFFDRSTMKRHMKRHFADRETYDCIACSKSFTRKDKLRDHLKSARHILTLYGPGGLVSAEKPTERVISPSSTSSPEHPGPSSDAIASLPVAEREVVRFMEKLRTMGKLEGLKTQLNNFNMIGNIISDNKTEAEGDNQEESRALGSVESPPLSLSPGATESP